MIVQLILKISLLPDSHHRDAHYLLYYPSGTLYSIWLLATLNARSSFKKDLPSYVDVTNLPAVPGEIRFRHPTVEGTEVVISIATHAVMSQDESLEETGSPSGYKQGKQGEELA
ncbi:hypothetical protein EYR36_001833 [Pleurotus pulmonarius]|nr:hypothetical protein EYR36_008226 [Pleurotus pulmonarius]KAF4580013.1 hypothetical protein EYR36_001833 [Pleurotus pulmonarius]